jgi:hypothetical protein
MFYRDKKNHLPFHRRDKLTIINHLIKSASDNHRHGKREEKAHALNGHLSCGRRFC